MDAEIISAASFVAAFDECVRKIRSRKPDLNKKHVLIVPDRYTLYAEKRLFSGGGAFDAEVVTFSRLLGKTGARPRGYVSRFGAIMLLRKLVGDGKELRCFHRSVQFAGFAEKLYDTIAQLIASDVTPDMLNGADGALGAKTQDIKRVYETYLAATQGRYVDASALLRLLPQAILTSGYLDGADVYILNFDRLTALHRRAVQAIRRRAAHTYLYEVAEKTDAKLRENAQITVYAAPDAATELKAAAARIRNDVYERGYRYGDFCIVTAGAEYGMLRRVFEEYGIPFSTDDKYPLALHPSARLLLCALDAADGRLKRDKLVRLSKIVLTGVDARESAAFENYCNRYRVDYKGFLAPFAREGESLAESARQKLLNVIIPLQSKLKPFMDAEAFAEAAQSVLDGAKHLDDFLSPYDLKSMRDKLYELVSLMREIMGGGSYPLETLTATLKEGIAGAKIAYLPTLSDCVAVGAPEQFRGQRFKRVFVLGFNEGVLPSVTEDCGVITDDEIDCLEALGAAVEPKTEEVNARARSELLHLLASCDRLFLSAVVTDGGSKPSGLLRLIEKSNPVVRYSRADEMERLAFAPDGLSLARAAGCKSAATELFVNGAGRGRAARAPYLSTLAAALGDDVKGLLNGGARDCTLRRRYDVFFKKSTVYISQLQTFFSCPYRHFLEYGLSLKERPDGTVSPKDVGVILHRIAELFARGRRFENPVQEAERIFDSLLAGEFKDFADLSQSAKRRMREEGVRLCRTVAAQLTGSKYAVLGEEMLFSATGNAPLSSPAVTLSDGRKISVVGVVDRVDVCENKARVIDYKTGFIGSGATDIFSLKKLYYGVKFQLQFYAYILKRNGYDVSGMFYFPVNNNWADGEDYCRMTGAFDSDLSSVFEMDTSLREGGKSALFNVNLRVNREGGLSMYRNALAFTRAELDAMCEYAAAIFFSGVRDVDDGFIRPLPYREGDRTACDYCPYSSVCALDGERTVRNLAGKADGAVTGGDER